jgi:hypothetical protein|tara:strand:+ start:75 stop:380 length:306 start_codon:yes stop_codon:yes gene_type:complete
MRKAKLIQLIENHPLVEDLWDEEDNGWWCSLKEPYVSVYSECSQIHVAESWYGYRSDFVDNFTQNQKDVSDLKSMWEQLKDPEDILTDDEWFKQSGMRVWS